MTENPRVAALHCFAVEWFKKVNQNECLQRTSMTSLVYWNQQPQISPFVAIRLYQHPDVDSPVAPTGQWQMAELAKYAEPAPFVSFQPLQVAGLR